MRLVSVIALLVFTISSSACNRQTVYTSAPTACDTVLFPGAESAEVTWTNTKTGERIVVPPSVGRTACVAPGSEWASTWAKTPEPPPVQDCRHVRSSVRFHCGGRS